MGNHNIKQNPQNRKKDNIIYIPPKTFALLYISRDIITKEDIDCFRQYCLNTVDYVLLFVILSLIIDLSIAITSDIYLNSVD